MPSLVAGLNTITADGTYTFPAGVWDVAYEMIGGGGAGNGGFGKTSSTGDLNGGGGGGGGQRLTGTFSTNPASSTVNITIGLGGIYITSGTSPLFFGVAAPGTDTILNYDTLSITAYGGGAANANGKLATPGFSLGANSGGIGGGPYDSMLNPIDPPGPNRYDGGQGSDQNGSGSSYTTSQTATNGIGATATQGLGGNNTLGGGGAGGGGGGGYNGSGGNGASYNGSGTYGQDAPNYGGGGGGAWQDVAFGTAGAGKQGVVFLTLNEVIPPEPASPNNISPICYAKGTLIGTSRGMVPIEHLLMSDKIRTYDRIEENTFKPVHGVPVKTLTRVEDTRFKNRFGDIKFIGKFTVDIMNEKTAPIRITAGSLGENQPEIDLLVSPNHSMLVGNRLIFAKFLVNGSTIYQDMSFKKIEYYHVLSDDHYIINANGALSETLGSEELAIFEALHTFPENVETIIDTKTKYNFKIVSKKVESVEFKTIPEYNFTEMTF
jgi:hypothetical protein